MFKYDITQEGELSLKMRQCLSYQREIIQEHRHTIKNVIVNILCKKGAQKFMFVQLRYGIKFLLKGAFFDIIIHKIFI